MKINDNIKEMIEENPVALATIGNDKKPYVIVVASVKVKDDKIVITNNYMKKTIENLKNSANVSLVVWNEDFEGYNMQGKAEYFENGEFFDFVQSLEENESEPCIGAIVIELNEIKKCG